MRCSLKEAIWKSRHAFIWHNNKHPFRRNTEHYSSKTHSTENITNTRAPCGTKLYDLPFSVLAANSENFGYAVIDCRYTILYDTHLQQQLFPYTALTWWSS